MFKFLKDKIKNAVDKITKSVEEDAEIEEVIEEPKIEEKKKEKPKPSPKLIKKEKPKTEKPKKVKKEIKKPEAKPEIKKSEPKVEKPKPVLKEVKKEKPKVEEKPKIEVKKEPPKVEQEPIVEEKLKVEIKKEVKPQIQETPKETIEEPKEEITEEKKEEVKVKEPKKRGFLGKIFGKKEEPKIEAKKPEITKEEPVIEKKTEEPTIQEEKSFLGRIKQQVTTIKLSEEKFNEIFWDLELGLLENNVAVEVIEKIKQDLKEELTTGRMHRKSVEEIIHDRLLQSIDELFQDKTPNLVTLSEEKKPFVIAMIGVNGSGKTTTLAKLIKHFQDNGKSVVVAAADTFRAAAIQQVEEHTKKLGVKLIKHDYNADPAAVAFDAIQHAKAKNIDIVLIDTAGRLHSNDNLMQELHKLIKVNKPDFKLFVGEAITGNDCVEQARIFNEAVGIDGIVLAKADVDEKGGAFVSVSYITGKPILYLGTGQEYKDLEPFTKAVVLENLGL